MDKGLDATVPERARPMGAEFGSSGESWPQSAMTHGSTGTSPLDVSLFSMARTTDLPRTTSPNTTCLPSRCGVGLQVMKNWEPFVFAPAFAY